MMARARRSILLLAALLVLPAAVLLGLRLCSPSGHIRHAESGRAAERYSSGILSYFASDPDLVPIERLALEERYVEAFREAVSALGERARHLGPFDSATFESLQWVGSVAALGGDSRTADDLFEALLALRRRSLNREDPILAETLLRRGRVARQQGDLDLAGRCFAEAKRIIGTGGGTGGRVEILGTAIEEAQAGLRLRTDLEAASRGYRRALSTRRRQGGFLDLETADTLTWLGWTLDRLDRPLEAAPYLAEARAQIRSLGLAGGALDATLEELQADQLAFEDRWEEAEPLYRAAATANAARRERYLGSFARRLSPPDGFAPLALAALRRGEGDRAWALMEQGRAATYRDFAALGLWSQRQPDGFHEARTVQVELMDLERRLDLARRMGSAAWEIRTWPLELRALELRARLSDLEARYLSDLERRGDAEPSLDRVRAMLGPRTALIGWLEVYIGGAPSTISLPRRSWGYVYVLRRTGPVRWVPLWAGRTPPENETPRSGWGTAFARVRRAAEWPLRVDAEPLAKEQMRDWSLRFFDPALPYLNDIDHLIVEGNRVPVELFADASGRFLVDRYDVTYAPSGSFLALLAERHAGHGTHGTGAPHSLLSVSAAPDRAGSPGILEAALRDDRRDLRWARGSYVRGQVALNQMPRLPFAGLEARAIARWFPDSRVIQGGSDVEGSVRRLAAGGRLQDYDVVHIATHTLVDEAPERCGLVLSESDPEPTALDDGVLDAEEILFGWRLDGAMLTLSACESAAAAGIWRGEEQGFPPALFAVGARSVLVSLWPVDDRATAILMDRFYQRLTGRNADGSVTRPLSPAAALRDAKIHVRELADGTGRRPFEHPAYWAGFVLIGLPGPPATSVSSVPRRHIP